MTTRSKSLFFVLFLAVVATVGFAFYGEKPHAQTASPAANTAPLSVENVGPLVREYLLANPEVVIEAVEAYQRKQEAQEQERQKESLQTHKDFLYSANPAASPAIGNPKGDVTIVEFFDYNCGYCKRALQEVRAVLETDKNVRFVFKEMPILSPTSHLAAQWALAAQRQDKYFAFHQKLMEHQGAIDEDTLARIAGDTGLDVERMKKDAADPKISETIAQNIQISQELGIRGTPAFIVNDRLVGGYVPLEELKSIIDEARKQN